MVEWTMSFMYKRKRRGPNTTSHTHTQTHTICSRRLIDKIFDPKRLEEAVNSFDSDKVAGPYSINPIVIQKAWNHIKSITRSIFIWSHELQVSTHTITLDRVQKNLCT